MSSSMNFSITPLLESIVLCSELSCKMSFCFESLPHLRRSDAVMANTLPRANTSPEIKEYGEKLNSGVVDIVSKLSNQLSQLVHRGFIIDILIRYFNLMSLSLALASKLPLGILFIRIVYLSVVYLQVQAKVTLKVTYQKCILTTTLPCA